MVDFMPDRATRPAWAGLGVPPGYDPAPVLGWTGTLTGRRLILASDDGWSHDIRAWGEPELDDRGEAVIPVVPELEWYRCLDSEVAPRDGTLKWWRVWRVWVEQGSIRF